MVAYTRAQIEEDFPLRELLPAVLADDPDRWRVTVAEPWCHVRPRAAVPRLQGWKLHLSATPLSAPFVLVAAARVLVAHGCAFKFAARLGTVSELTGGRADRGGGGKFLTVYPADDEQFRLLAEELHRATDGLPGPTILSDRRYRLSSPVHYRYGAFSGVNRLSDDGTYENMLTAPDGTLLPDPRKAWFTPPEWAGNPFPGDATAVTTRRKPAAVLLDDRFEVRRALKHGNSGGVFLATDRTDGATVVVKQARPHTESSLTGTDARDVLRHEARMLDRLAATGVTPRPIGLFEQGGDLFLAEEHRPGQPLRAWTQDRVRDGGVDVPTSVTLARRIVALVDAVHSVGPVIRDLGPNNLLVTDDLRVSLVDLEFAADPGAATRRAHTPGYGAPEVERAPRFGPAPDHTADLYSLGATLFHLATGTDPVFAPDDPTPGRPARERLVAVVGTMAADLPALRALAPAVLGLTADEPADRWSLARTAVFLTDPETGNRTDAATGAGAETTPAVPTVSVERALGDGVRHLVRLVDTDGIGEVARSSAFGRSTDRCNAQHGAAGLLAVLCRARSAGVGEVPAQLVADLARWIVDRLPREPRTLPGLWFGRSGTAWALADAARHLDDPALAAAARELAGRTPLTWPNPDVCHGAAGAGLAQLHLWRSLDDPAHLDRAVRCADGLAAAAERDGTEVWWPVPRTFASVFAGTAQLGFGHGVAGVGAFLLRVAQATGRADLFDLAVDAGRTLAARAVREPAAAWWPADRAERTPVRRYMTPHWCGGASGIGGFLVRLWAATGDDELRDLAEKAAETAWRARWVAPPVQCHGLAGDGEFLLDLAERTGDDRHRRRAEELAAVALSRYALRDGLVVPPDESHVDVVADFQTGLAGTCAFLLRLRHGGPRMWFVDVPADVPAGDRADGSAGDPAGVSVAGGLVGAA